jgi:hypothetical protein
MVAAQVAENAALRRGCVVPQGALCVTENLIRRRFRFSQSKNPCSCVKIPCSSEKIPCSVAQGISLQASEFARVSAFKISQSGRI